MEPNIRGEIAIDIGGRRYVLRPSLAVLIRIEEQFDMSLPEIASMFAKTAVENKKTGGNKTPKTGVVLKIVYAALLETQPSLSWEGFNTLIWGKVSMQDIYIAGTKLLYSCVSCGKEPEVGEASPEPSSAATPVIQSSSEVVPGS